MEKRNPIPDPYPEPDPRDPRHVHDEAEDRPEGEVVGAEGVGGNEEGEEEEESCPRRTNFANLSQVDRDLALARTLQEQEAAYMMLRVGNGYGFSEPGSEYEVEEYGEGEGEGEFEEYGEGEGEGEFEEHGVFEEDLDAFDAQEHGFDIDAIAYEGDETYARDFQSAEQAADVIRLFAMAVITNEWVTETLEDHGTNSQETWLEIDPQDFSYEELIALGEAVGTESRGLSDAAIASLPSVCYKAQSDEDEHNNQCVICRLDYEDGDCLLVLPCKHTYHSECINKWLHIKKVCPVCSAEVSTS